MKDKVILKAIFSICIIIFVLAIIIICIEKNKDKYENKNEVLNNTENEVSLVKQDKYECNEFSITTIDAESLMNIYLNDYINKVLENPEMGYEVLDEDYKKNIFGNLEEYKKYINKHIEELKKITLNKYRIVNYENYSKYICSDQYNNYYVFEVKSVMNYSLKLDTYTIDSQNDKNNYIKASIKEKMMINIEKIIDAVNDENYNYVYNKLDDSFKKRKYLTEEKLKNNIKRNLFKMNAIETNEIDTENDIYINHVKIYNQTNKNEKKDMTIIMQLKEDTDFVFSFSFE